MRSKDCDKKLSLTFLIKIKEIQNILRTFRQVEIEIIKPKVVENIDNDENHDDPLPLQNVKLPSLIKPSMLCKQSPKTDQAYCDTEERLDVSWI